jgi:histidinol-phosphate phosphatase family protein
MTRAAVFLDKDGTLVDDVPFNVDPERIRLVPGAMPGLCLLAQAGYELIVVSNQAGVARGLFTEAALVGVELRLRELLADIGVRLAGFYYCPHDPHGQVASYAVRCACRKPAPGLLLQAAAIHDIDLSRSWFIGDILDDVEAGNRAGCRTVLIYGNETQWYWSRQRLPHAIVDDLGDAAHAVLTGAPCRQRARARAPA